MKLVEGHNYNTQLIKERQYAINFNNSIFPGDVLAGHNLFYKDCYFILPMKEPKIPVDLQASEFVSRYHIRVACMDGRKIDLYQREDSLVAETGGTELWRSDRPSQSGAVYNGLKFDGYDAALRQAERGRDPTGYVIAHLRSSETDSDSHDLNRGVGIILNPLTGEEVHAFGPSW